MKGHWRKRLASWNRYLALAGLVLALAGLSTLAILGRRFIPGYGLLVGGLLLLVAAWGVDPAAARRALAGPAMRFAVLLLLSSLALLGILALLNVLAFRFYGRWDLSQDAAFALSPQTRQALDGLAQPVQVTGFFYDGQDDWEQQARLRLESYRAYSRWISYQIVDPEVRPAMAEAYGVGRAYALAVECGGRRTLIYSTDEQALTSAILQVALQRPVTVYVHSEHGEVDLANTAPEGYSTAREILEAAGYRVVARPLAADSGTLPVTDTVVVLLGPQSALPDGQERRLLDYLGRGGRMLVLLDPASPDLDLVLGTLGVVAERLTIVDPQYNGGDPTIPVVYVVNPDHPISRSLPATAFPGARPLSPADPSRPGPTSALLVTSPASWGESNPQQQPAVLDAGEDMAGPLALAVALEGRPAWMGAGPDLRLVVVGDSGFASNAYVGGGNAQLFLGAVNWLAEKDMPAVEFKERRVIMDSVQVNIVRYVTLIGLPLAVLTAGMIVWWARRRGQGR